MSVLSTCINGYFEGKKIIYFGAGQYSVAAIRNIHQKIAYFCDNALQKQGTKCWGIPVFSPAKLLEENREQTLILINTEHYREVAAQLLGMGFENIYSDMYKRANEPIPRTEARSQGFLQKKAEAVRSGMSEIRGLLDDAESKVVLDKLFEKYRRGSFDFSEACSKEKVYFNDIFSSDMREDEIYVDAGAFDGKTVVDFMFFANGKYRKIYAFEPDAVNFILLVRELSDCRDTVTVQAGLSDMDGAASFDLRGTQSSKIVKEVSHTNFTRIRTLRLDTFIKEPITFIKMDIEGGEYNALVGASETIRKNRPKLAISVYHNDDDLIRIPRLIHELVPEYRLYLRQHTPFPVDTVLYAKL